MRSSAEAKPPLMQPWQGTYPVSIALVHYPTVDKQGLLTATSTTNFDIHDLARLARTYGLAQYYIVTPVPSQIEFVHRVIDHWDEGWGGDYNPTRREAMRTVVVAQDLNKVAAHIERTRARIPRFVMTTAKRLPHRITFSHLAELIAAAPPHDGVGESAPPPQLPQPAGEFCIVFGTGWGLHPSLAEDMDYALEPLPGLSGDYNHLSVRAAAAIIIDRLIQQVKTKQVLDRGHSDEQRSSR